MKKPVLGKGGGMLVLCPSFVHPWYILGISSVNPRFRFVQGLDLSANMRKLLFQAVNIGFYTKNQ